MKRIFCLGLLLLGASSAGAQFNIPNSGDLLRTDIAILRDAANGTGVVSGSAVTAQGSPDMTVAVASGVVRVGTTTANVTSGNVTITAAHGSSPRIDLIVVNSSGTKSAVAGTAATLPDAPDIPASSVVLAYVSVPALDTTISTAQIIDKRVTVPALTELAIGTAYQYVRVNTGATSPEYATLAGTANQLSITHAAGTTTFAIPSAFQTNATATGTVTIDWGAGNRGGAWYGTLSGNITIATSNPVVGEMYQFIITQGASGANTVTWPSEMKWSGGAAPTQTVTANEWDVISCRYIAAATYVCAGTQAIEP